MRLIKVYICTVLLALCVCVIAGIFAARTVEAGPSRLQIANSVCASLCESCNLQSIFGSSLRSLLNRCAVVLLNICESCIVCAGNGGDAWIACTRVFIFSFAAARASEVELPRPKCCTVSAYRRTMPNASSASLCTTYCTQLTLHILQWKISERLHIQACVWPMRMCV